METKAYFASSVPAAFEVARQELGENALLVSSRASPPQARHFGRLEVTFAWDPKEAPAPPMPLPRAALPPATLPRATFPRATFPRATTAYPAVTLERLIDAGFLRETAALIASGAARRPGNPDTALLQEITSRIPAASFVEIKPGEHRTLAFIGPPGRGKTISLVKIAVRLGLARRVPVRVYCAGVHGIGAEQQMTRFSAILGTPHQAFESLGRLDVALNGDAWKGLTLIDTPGISPADRNELGEFTGFFASHPEIEKHLVLRADASSADMVRMMSLFAGLTPSRLLFTGMDEAIGVVSVVDALIRGKIPATFAGTGRQIPEDLEEVNAHKLARIAWTGAGAVAAAANARIGRTATA